MSRRGVTLLVCLQAGHSPYAGRAQQSHVTSQAFEMTAMSNRQKVVRSHCCVVVVMMHASQ